MMLDGACRIKLESSYETLTWQFVGLWLRYRAFHSHTAAWIRRSRGRRCREL